MLAHHSQRRRSDRRLLSAGRSQLFRGLFDCSAYSAGRRNRCDKAGIPRRRHRHGHFHRHPRDDPREDVGESVRVGVGVVECHLNAIVADFFWREISGQTLKQDMVRVIHWTLWHAEGLAENAKLSFAVSGRIIARQHQWSAYRPYIAGQQEFY